MPRFRSRLIIRPILLLALSLLVVACGQIPQPVSTATPVQRTAVTVVAPSSSSPVPPATTEPIPSALPSPAVCADRAVFEGM